MSFNVYLDDLPADNLPDGNERPQAMKTGRSLLRQTAPGIVISLVIVLILARIVDWRTVAVSFRNVSPGLIAALAGLLTASFAFRALAWRIALADRPSWVQSFWTVTEGYLLNLMPLRLGEIGRAVIMGGLVDRSPLYVFSTILLERFFDLLVTVIFLLVSIPLVGGATISPLFYLVLGALMIVGLIVLFALVKRRESLFVWLEARLKPDSKFGRIVLPLFRSVFEGLAILATPRRFGIWLFWILATWVCWFAAMLVALRGFFPDLPAWSTLFIQGFSALGGAIPSAPAGIGVIEGATVVALSFFGIAESPALAFAIFNHSIGILTPVVLGLIGFTVQGQSLALIFRRLRETRLSDNGEEKR